MALHERHLSGGECGHAFAEALDVTLEDGREIGICQCGVSAWHPPRQWGYLMRAEHLREARRSRRRRGQQFVAWMRPTVQQTDGDCFAAFGTRGRQRGLQGMTGGGVEWHEHAAVVRHALCHFDDTREQGRRPAQFAMEQLWSVLLTNHRQVGEAGCHH